jgi:integral membrane protein
MAYIAMAYVVKEEKNWPLKKLAIAFIAAFLPFGTFVFDARLKADQMANK